MRTVFGILMSLALAFPAMAQNSPVTLSPDGHSLLVQKNLGLQRWAIVRDQSSRSVTGNIFNPEGGSQFVWCENQGGEQYRCLGSDGCAQEPCIWSLIANVAIPESFFTIAGRPVPTPFPTPRPTSAPTPQPTQPPVGGLQGLLGTWELTFTIISTFTFEYRLQRVQTGSSGYPIIVGRNVIGDTIVVARIQDLDPGNGLPFEYALAEQVAGVCQLYVFDQSGADRVSGLHSSALELSNGDCGSFLGEDFMTGVRVSRLASAKSAFEATVVKRAINRRTRSLRSEMRDAKAAVSAHSDDLFRTLMSNVAEAPR